MSSFFFSLVPDALFTGAGLAFFSPHVSQCSDVPSFRKCMPSTSSVSRATSLKLLCHGALCHCTTVQLWAAWLPNQGDQPLRTPVPCAMPGERSVVSALGPRLHTKGRTRKAYRSSLVQIKGRKVSSCVQVLASFPLGYLLY